jgi:hypothetical protein
MTPEQQRALALAAARRRRAEAEQRKDPEGGLTRMMGLLNQGIANVGDAIAGPINRGVNMGMEAVGLDARVNEAPFAGAMDTFGVARTETPRNLSERMVTGAGEAAGAILPAAGVLSAIGRAGGVVGNAANTIRAGLATRTGMMAEMAAGGGAVAGEEMARNAGGGDVAGGLGALAGGLLGGVSVAGVPIAARRAGDALMAAPLSGSVIRGVVSALAPFTRTGGRVIAQDMIRGATADPYTAANALGEPNIGGLTPAQQTGDEGIMGIERAVAAADPQFRGRLNAQTEASRAALEGEVAAPAAGRTPRDLKQFFADRFETHRKTVGRYVTQAERRLDAAMRGVSPGRSREDASVWATKIIDEAFDRASKQEAELWRRVPRNVTISTARAREALAAARDEATRVSEDAIPGKARFFLGDDDGAMGESATMGELHRLYSEMRRAAREAMARPVPDEFTARQAGRIADGILADIEATEGTSNVARLLADARAFSSQVAEQFGQGNVSRILARTRAGDERIAPESALRSTVGQGREAGGVAVDDLRRAGGNQIDAPVQDFLRDEFTTAARRPDGQVDPAAVARFGERNREALERFPSGVGSEVSGVRAAARDVVRRRERMADIVAALDETTRGTVAGVVNAPKGREVARGIFEADNPAAAARTIARAAQRDSTGDAYLGLKAGIYDEVIRRASGDGAINGEKMLRVLNDPDVGRVIAAALPPDEMSRLRIIATQIRKIERSMSARAVDTENLPNSLLSTFVQIQAAKAGRAAGTGTIQVPGIFVARTREYLARVFNDKADATIRAALEDPRFMADLLIGPTASKQRIAAAERRMTQWALGVLAASGEEE